MKGVNASPIHGVHGQREHRCACTVLPRHCPSLITRAQQTPLSETVSEDGMSGPTRPPGPPARHAVGKEGDDGHAPVWTCASEGDGKGAGIAVWSRAVWHMEVGEAAPRDKYPRMPTPSHVRMQDIHASCFEKGP